MLSYRFAEMECIEAKELLMRLDMQEAYPKGWDYAWTESDFSRDEIIQRWEEEKNG